MFLFIILKIIGGRSDVERLCPDMPADDRPRVLCLARRGYGINAMAFADGTVLVTPELIAFIEHCEELDAVLKHEFRHIQGGHQTIRSNDIVEMVGQLRLQEYESDAAAFLGLADARLNSNPNGMISFLERLRSCRDDSTREAWDIAHGTLTDRILTLKLLRNSLNTGSDSNPLADRLLAPFAPFPQALRSVTQRLARGDASAWLHQCPAPGGAEWQRWLQSLEAVCSRTHVSERQLVIVVTRLLPCLCQQLKAAAALGASASGANRTAGTLKHHLELALSRWIEISEAHHKAAGLPERQAALLTALEIDLGGGPRIFSSEKPPQPLTDFVRKKIFGTKQPQLQAADYDCLLACLGEVKAPFSDDTLLAAVERWAERALCDGVFDHSTKRGINT